MWTLDQLFTTIGTPPSIAQALSFSSANDGAGVEVYPNPTSMPIFCPPSHRRTPTGARLSWNPSAPLRCSAGASSASAIFGIQQNSSGSAEATALISRFIVLLLSYRSRFWDAANDGNGATIPQRARSVARQSRKMEQQPGGGEPRGPAARLAPQQYRSHLAP